MPETLIKVDLSKPAPTNEMVHNRWHPDIPMACWVKPGDEFVLETYDWTGGFIKNNDSADDVRRGENLALADVKVHVLPDGYKFDLHERAVIIPKKRKAAQ